MINKTPAWEAVSKLAASEESKSLRERFDSNPGRADSYSYDVDGLRFDFSKHLIDDDVVSALIALAEEAGISDKIKAMYRGDHINSTEDRAVLHTALRIAKGAELVVDGQDVAADVHGVLDHMASFAESVRSGEWVGATGQPIRTVINLSLIHI